MSRPASGVVERRTLAAGSVHRFVVAILGHPKGRWRDQCRVVGPCSTDVAFIERRRADCDLCSLEDLPCAEVNSLLGFVVTREWRFVRLAGERALSTERQELAIMKGLLARYHRQVKFLGFDVYDIMAAGLLTEADVVVDDLADMPLWSPDFSNGILEKMHAASHARFVLCAKARFDDNDQTQRFDRVSSTACDWFGFLRFAQQLAGDNCARKFVGWQVWHGLGDLMVRYAWPCDVVPIPRRPGHSSAFQRLSTQLAWRHISAYMNSSSRGEAPRDMVVADLQGEAEPFVHAQIKTPIGGASNVVGYSPTHLILALDVGSNLKDQAKLKDSLEKMIQFGPPRKALELVGELSVDQFEFPSKWCLWRARERLDFVSMLMNRSLCTTSPSTCRCLKFDASPQAGVEMFGVVEFEWDAKFASCYLRHACACISSCGTHVHAFEPPYHAS